MKYFYTWLGLPALIPVAMLAGTAVVLPGAARLPQPTPTIVNPVFRSKIRSFLSLDGEWRFAFDPSGIGEKERWYATVAPYSRTIQVPGPWEAQGAGQPGLSHPTHIEGYPIPPRNEYVGDAWYQKEFLVPSGWNGKHIWLKVGAVNSEGWFWVNGTYIGFIGRYCGAYKFDITRLVGSGNKNTVTVRVSNKVKSHKGLLNWLDQFGGLYRSVEIEATSPVYIYDLWARPDFDECRADFFVTLFAPEPRPVSGDYRLMIKALTLPDDQIAGEAAVSIPEISNTGTEVSVPARLNPFQPWSPAAPALYRGEVVLEHNGQAIDSWPIRFGVRKIVRRGKNIYLNGKKIFLRGFGDDYDYPLTLASPPSRAVHRKDLELAKTCGFDYVRLHTHVETPEYFQAADEVGIMVQPALPYAGNRPATKDGSYAPLDDLDELIHQYRRYVSLTTYCMGNEGWHDQEFRVPLYRFAKLLDPTRLVYAEDGADIAYEGISDLRGGPIGRTPIEPDEIHGDMPIILHEYLNLSGPTDYRLMKLFTGAEAPPYRGNLHRPGFDRNVPKQLFVNTRPEPLSTGGTTLGISPALAERVILGGQELQSIYQKLGIERARATPGVKGYDYWTIFDVNALMPQGLLNMFWQPKKSTSKYFRQFNSPAVLLLPVLSPLGTDRISTSGEKVSYRLECSNYSLHATNNATISWTLVAEGKIRAQGTLEKVNVPQGTIGEVGRIEFAMPETVRPVKIELKVKIGGLDVENRWDFFCFPANWVHVRVKKAWASKTVYDKLHSTYRGLLPAGQSVAHKRHGAHKLLITENMGPQELAFLKSSGTVLLLSQKTFSPLQPGIWLGWWGPDDQRGTAMAPSPAFGNFPTEEGMPSFAIFRLIQDAVLLKGDWINHVDPLIVTLSRSGYSLSVFQCRVGSGRLFASGLDLLSGKPEGAYLLDQFIRYIQSDQFQPKNELDPNKLIAMGR
jgi:Glycosyl hydrolases family 2, sugar binding domain/Glycosyl hydrolases family 2/Glycosyl hydrolases family 2, TIM barrel domain